MTFAVPADAYDRFMGRYSVHLSAQLADLADITAGQRVIDVGCGPGALTTELVERLGSAAVVAVDPSESFVRAARARMADVDVRQASAEQLPFPDDGFDAALAQLVVHFMADPAAGLRRDASRHAPRRVSWPRACGITEAARDRSARCGRRRTSSIPRSQASRRFPGRAGAT